ncbi:hypothetical protein [Kineosporia babensis]|uniref:Uncharacterized protein n=1 Tax=Kineosporia babensis TaxID=499548 RepID=A0A9X1SSL9_9ACTN|nr:hypothetical protein [Kineosporia babensis]MCD5310797.1 hypothetical protein [Kineosporia babensis]
MGDVWIVFWIGLFAYLIAAEVLSYRARVKRIEAGCVCKEADGGALIDVTVERRGAGSERV